MQNFKRLQILEEHQELHKYNAELPNPRKSTKALCEPSQAQDPHEGLTSILVALCADKGWEL